MPIGTRLTAVPAAGPQPLAAYLAAVSAGEHKAPDLVVVPVRGAESAGIDVYLGVSVAAIIAGSQVSGRAGEIFQTVAASGGGPPVRLAFAGLGDESPGAMRAAGAAVGRHVPPGGSLVTSAAWGMPDEAVAAFAEGLLLGSYRFTLASGEVPGREPGEARVLVAGPDGQDLLGRAGILAGAVALARDLTNMPSARKSPRWLADEALSVAAAGGLSARVWEPAELAAHGFGGLLAVGSGSARPPRLIELAYVPQGWHGHVVLVGKGITFDSGGLSLKPTEGMQLMKTDMAGGGVVIAVMSALARLGVPVRVTGLVPAAENMPSGSALRPGDVITHFGGRTDEVLNTDAEGRLVLADALAYADTVLAPDVMVDVATLTGAVRVALGTAAAALYATDDRLADTLLEAAATSGDGLWRMPLVDEYAPGLESPVADISNVARGSRRRAGSIDAALFLREFTGGRPWAHLDIAGAARSASDVGENTKGATGFGTRLLLRWLAGGAEVPAGERSGAAG